MFNVSDSHGATKQDENQMIISVGSVNINNEHKYKIIRTKINELFRTSPYLKLTCAQRICLSLEKISYKETWCLFSVLICLFDGHSEAVPTYCL